MNWIGLKTLFTAEMKRTFAIPTQTLLAPVLTTALYFVVFGAAMGSSISVEGGMGYGEYIVPGLIMMAVLTNALAAASSGIFVPMYFGSSWEIFSAPLSYLEIIIGYVSAAAVRAMIIAAAVLATAFFFTDISIEHVWFSFLFVSLTSLSFALLGFILGLVSKNFDSMNFFPSIILTPLIFLGGVFYSIKSLPDFWQTVSLFNPVVYMIDGLRWGFFGFSDISPQISVLSLLLFSSLCVGVIFWIFKTGYKVRK